MAPPSTTVFSSDYLIKVSKKTELITRLNNLHQSLSKLSQEKKDRPKVLRTIAGHLVSRRILGNADREVRLLACCCIVDILRIYAPDAPYSGEELCEAFDGIIFAIRGLSTYDPSSNIGSKIFYILNNISTLRSCSIIIYLAEQGVDGAADRLKELFEALVSSIREEHTEAVAGHVGSVLQVLIEESESIDQELLDILLAPLLPAAKTENPAAFKLVQSVLRRTTLALQSPISKFVNKILVGSMAVDDDGARGGETSGESDLSEHIYALIYELHKVSPDLLLRILPNICVQLQAEDFSIRLKAIRLLGRLFASPHAEYGVQFARNFRDFLGRFVDISEEVRLEMIDHGFMIINHKPQLRDTVIEHICKRLRDGSSDVRFAALGRLLDTAMEDPTFLSAEVFREMGERVKDKKQQVRKVAQIGLAKVFWRHISLPALAFPEDGGSELIMAEGSEPDAFAEALALSLGVHPEVWRRLNFVPGFIVNCWGYPDPLDKHLVIQLFQEQILPKPPKATMASQDESLQEAVDSALAQCELSPSDSSADISVSEDIGRRSLELWERKRATLLLRIFCTLDPTQKTCLGGILSFKAKVRMELSQFITKWVGTANKPNIAFHMSRAGFRLLQHFPPSLAAAEKKSTTGAISFDKLVLSKDKTILRLVKAAISVLPPSRSSARPTSSSSRQMATPDESEFCVASVISRACVQRDDLRRRLDSKSALGQYLQRLFDTSSLHMLANPYTIRSLLSHMAAISGASEEEEDDEEARTSRMAEMKSTSDLLILLAKYFPMVFAGAAPEISEWLVAICEGGFNAVNDEEREENDSVKKRAKTSKAGRASSVSAASSRRRLAIQHTALSECVQVLKYASKCLSEPCEDVSGDREYNSSTARDLCRCLLEYATHNTDPKACEMLAEGSVVSAESAETGMSASRLCDTMGVTTAINTICRPSRLVASAALERLACDLHVIASLLGAYGDSVRELSGSFGRLSSFLSDIIFNKKSEFHRLHRGRASSSSSASTDGRDSYLFVLLGALKVWSELVFKKALRESMATGVSPFHPAPGSRSLSDDEEDAVDFSARDHLPLEERFPEYTVQLLTILFTSISSFGAKLGDIDVSSTACQVKLRETAAVCLIRMLKVKSIGKGINSVEWQALAWTLLDENEECRRNILQALGVLIQTHCVHPRFLSLPCLLASDEQLHRQAEQSLLFAMKRLRCTHAELCTRVMAMSEGDSEEGKLLRRIADDNAPECVVPYVIYLLSHHPDFPVSLDLKSAGDDERMKIIVRSVKMVFNILLLSLGKDSDNLPFLMKQVSIVSRFYRDRHDESNEALRFVTKIASNVLKTHIKTQEDIQPFVGDVSLPMDLFERAEGSGDFEVDDDAGVNRAIAAASRAEHGAHHRLPRGVAGTSGPLKKSPSKPAAPVAASRKRITTTASKKKKQTDKPVPSVPAPSRVSSRRRSSASGVSYADTRDSDDEAEMEQIEEILSSTASTSQQSHTAAARGGRYSSGSAGSMSASRWPMSLLSGRSSSGSGTSRQSFGSATGSPLLEDGPVLNKENSSVMAKKRKFSGGWAGVASWDEEDRGSTGESPTVSPTELEREQISANGHSTGFASRRRSHSFLADAASALPAETAKAVAEKPKSRTSKKSGVLENLPITPADVKKKRHPSASSFDEVEDSKKKRSARNVRTMKAARGKVKNAAAVTRTGGSRIRG